MENLFLEILRVLDNRYHKDKKNNNTDFYLIPLNYYKLILSKKNISEDDLILITKEEEIKSISLFSISKSDLTEESLKEINFKNPSASFYKSRDILLFICMFIKFITIGDNFINYEIEKFFFNCNIDNRHIEKFIFIIKLFNNSDGISSIYNEKFILENIRGCEDFNNYINNYLLEGIKLFLKYNSFVIGMKKSLD